MKKKLISIICFLLLPISLFLSGCSLFGDSDEEDDDFYTPEVVEKTTKEQVEDLFAEINETFKSDINYTQTFTYDLSEEFEHYERIVNIDTTLQSIKTSVVDGEETNYFHFNDSTFDKYIVYEKSDENYKQTTFNQGSDKYKFEKIINYDSFIEKKFSHKLYNIDYIAVFRIYDEMFGESDLVDNYWIYSLINNGSYKLATVRCIMSDEFSHVYRFKIKNQKIYNIEYVFESDLEEELFSAKIDFSYGEEIISVDKSKYVNEVLTDDEIEMIEDVKVLHNKITSSDYVANLTIFGEKFTVKFVSSGYTTKYQLLDSQGKTINYSEFIVGEKTVKAKFYDLKKNTYKEERITQEEYYNWLVEAKDGRYLTNMLFEAMDDENLDKLSDIVILNSFISGKPYIAFTSKLNKIDNSIVNGMTLKLVFTGDINGRLEEAYMKLDGIIEISVKIEYGTSSSIKIDFDTTKYTKVQ